MRNFAEKIFPTYQGRLIDTCGTGGDNSHTFNISTLSALVAAGAGALCLLSMEIDFVSPKCGLADLLERFGVNLNLEPKEVEGIISKIGIAFLFAPKFHPAMKFAGPLKALAIRTIFNLLGPLTNPANAKGHVLGVYDPTLVEPILDVMIRLGERIFMLFVLNPASTKSSPSVRSILANLKKDSKISIL